MNDAVKWSDESTREFIQLRYKLRHLFNGRKHVCAKAYRRIVEELGLSDVITPAQARKKWSNLLQKYKDIKSGYSTANEDWPYFQILDAIVPLMRKEMIELGPKSSIDKVDGDLLGDNLTDPITTTISADKSPLSLDTSVYPSLTSSSSDMKCKMEMADGEPPLKKQKGRRAAQKARERWWGAVEDEDLGSDSGGSATRGENSMNRLASKTTFPGTMDPTQMELQSFQMMKSCSESLAEIQETLRLHAKNHQDMMEKLTQTVEQQGDVLKNLLSTISTQNAALIALTNQISGEDAHAGLSSNRSYGQLKHRSVSQSRQSQENELLASQQNLINALSHDTQDCDSALVDNSELPDNITGL